MKLLWKKFNAKKIVNSMIMIENRNLECICKPENGINTVEKTFKMKKAYDTFYDVLKYPNYKVMMCYKLVFNSDIFSYNKGFWIIFILFLLYLSQFGIYNFKKISPLKLHIARHHFKIKTQKDTKNKICETYSNKHNDLLSEKIDKISSGDKI